MEPGPAAPKTLRTADDLFFGSCPVHLQAVPGETVNFVADEWAVDMGEPALAVTLRPHVVGTEHPAAERCY